MPTKFGRADRWLTGAALLTSLIAASTASAQQAAPVTPATTPPPPAATTGTPPQATPVPPPVTVVPTAPLPTLSARQAAQLRTMLADGRMSQGLRMLAANARALPEDNDGLVRAALDYARAVHAGRLDTADFDEEWGLRPGAYDPMPSFVQAVKEDKLAGWIGRLPPPYAGYDGLQRGLESYRAIDAAGGWKPVPAGPDLGVGASGARVAALRARLAVEDKAVVATGAKFDAELKEAVQRAQRRYGLNPTGVVSSATLAALNVPAGDRVRQIMANMERWRWLPKELPKDRIQVNIAAAVVTVFDGDNPVMSMRGVTGKPGGGETPMLQSTIHSVVLNPPWNVPSGIAAKELFPKGAAYLRANGFKIIGEGPSRRLQQQPSHSALGKYKFDFDNPYAVYLHDTPTQATFSRFDRLASHGCIRLERPADLAQLLLRDTPEWNAGQIDDTIAKGETVRARLKTQVAVYLLYWTAFASANGTMNFRGDPYGWDRKLADKIEKRSAAQAVAAR